VALILVIPSVMAAGGTAAARGDEHQSRRSAGPKTGGMQMIGGRPIQAALPSTEPQIAKNTLPPWPDAAEDGLAGSEAEAADAPEARSTV
jgi:hypothetical protein